MTVLKYYVPGIDPLLGLLCNSLHIYIYWLHFSWNDCYEWRWKY